MEKKAAQYNLAKLLVVTAFLSGCHIAIYIGIPAILERFVSPDVPPTSQEAQEIAQATFEARRLDGCWSYPPLSRQKDSCQRAEIKRSNPPSGPDVNEVFRDYRANYEWRILDPLVEKTRDAVHVFFGLSYAWLVLIALIPFFRRLRSVIAPATARGMSKLAVVPDQLKGLGESRILKQAEREILTLEKLRDSGLLSEEAFAKKHSALKATLGKLG